MFTLKEIPSFKMNDSLPLNRYLQLLTKHLSLLTAFLLSKKQARTFGSQPVILKQLFIIVLISNKLFQYESLLLILIY